MSQRLSVLRHTCLGHRDWVLGVLLSALLPLAHAASPTPTITPSIAARPVFGTLDASELAQIQTISQGILTAKAGERVSAQEQAMLQSLHALSAAMMLTTTRTPSLTINLAAGPLATPLSQVTEQATLEGRLRPHLNALAQHIQAVQQLSVQAEDGSGSPKQVHLLQLASQISAVTQTVEALLAQPDDAERSARLAELGRRLRSRTPAQWWADQRAQARSDHLPDPLPDSPTLTTQAHHRAGLDELQSNGGQ